MKSHENINIIFIIKINIVYTEIWRYKILQCYMIKDVIIS